MNILSICDSFKGTMTSTEVSKIIIEELKTSGHKVNYIPISDGGEEFLEVFKRFTEYETIFLEVNNPLFKLCKSSYLFNKKDKIAIIELAKSSGLILLKEDELNPFITSTYGLGEIIKDAIKKGATQITVGIGGSATNDAGVGILEALGVKFYDCNNFLLTKMNNQKLKQIVNIDTTEFEEFIKNISFTILSDVSNPLLGENGATYIYSKQKGAQKEDLKFLEENIAHFASFRPEKINYPGAGAAGGVGYVFRAYFNCRLVSGIDYILDMIEYEKIIQNYDLIITGEGKLDNQSMQGKVVKRIIDRTNKNKRLIVICAINELDYQFSDNVKIYSIVNDECSKKMSLDNPQFYLKKLIRKMVL